MSVRAREGRVKSFDGTDIAYFVAGADAGAPTIVLANGLGGTYEVWRHQTEFFASRYRIVTWDYRGLYRSARPRDLSRTTVADHVRDLEAVLDAAGIDKAIFIGWSMGVQVNFELCRTQAARVRGIVALNGTAGRPWETVLPFGQARPLIAKLLWIARTLPGPVGFGWQRIVRSPEILTYAKRLGLASPHLDEEIFHDLAAQLAAVDLEAYFAIFERLGDHDARDVLASLRVPTLVIAGEHDRMTPEKTARAIADAVPGAELFIVPGGSHYTAIEYPELINLRIDKFLTERVGA